MCVFSTNFFMVNCSLQCACSSLRNGTKTPLTKIQIWDGIYLLRLHLLGGNPNFFSYHHASSIDAHVTSTLLIHIPHYCYVQSLLYMDRWESTRHGNSRCYYLCSCWLHFITVDPHYILILFVFWSKMFSFCATLYARHGNRRRDRGVTFFI